jgi:hypothetical protein
VTVAVLPDAVAVTVAVPRATAVTRPPGLETVATPVALETKVEVDVRLAVEASL